MQLYSYMHSIQASLQALNLVRYYCCALFQRWMALDVDIPLIRYFMPCLQEWEPEVVAIIIHVSNYSALE